MKKLFTLVMALIFSAGLMAQNLVPGGVPADQTTPDPVVLKHFAAQKMSSKALESRWYCYGITMDDILQSAEFNFNNLFPDTTILVNYGTSGYSGPWIHSLGNMLDPTSDWFNDPLYYPTGLKVNKHMTYSLDSVGMNFIYIRNDPNPAIVDTLRIQVAVDPVTGMNFGRGYWLQNQLPHFGSDTVWYKRIYFDQMTLAMSATGAMSYDIPLNEAFSNDTLSDGTHFAQVATPEFANIPAGNIVATYITYIPGYSWIANSDTLFNRNGVRFFSYEENGDDTYPNYTKNDYNCSYIGNDDSHFLTSGWGGRVIPTWAWTSPYGYENHLIWYHLTADMSGVEDLASDILTLKQNYPNPATTSTTIEYSLTDNANVNLGIYDITGAMVMQLNQGVVTRGQHQIQVDLSNLSNGLYYFTLEAGSSKVSRKMVVQK